MPERRATQSLVDQGDTADPGGGLSRLPRLKPLKAHPQSLTQMVADSIRDAIMSREFAPGTRITEAMLAAQLGVSKTPVREALLRLQYIGVMEPDGPRGGRIVAASVKAIVDAYQIRETLEVQAARLAASHATEKDIAEINKAGVESTQAAAGGQVEMFRKWDRRFHHAVADAAGNERLAEMIRDALLLTWTLRRRDVPLADDSLECAKHHEAIAKSIANRRAEAAAEAMSFHISHVRDIVVAAFPSKA
jgi:GntR family transcriptional regulator, rspAB operon transcriptional repressor